MDLLHCINIYLFFVEHEQNEIEECELHNTVSLHTGDNGTQVNKMYVELLNEQLLKPCHQTQELKLVKESADRYVILTDDDSILNASSMVVKQNNDGTISMTDKGMFYFNLKYIFMEKF